MLTHKGRVIIYNCRHRDFLGYQLLQHVATVIDVQCQKPPRQEIIFSTSLYRSQQVSCQRNPANVPRKLSKCSQKR